MTIRVLVIDDSVVVRRVLTETLQSDPDVEVAGTAATASIGLQKIPQVAPDVVLLDVEMPEMDGIEAARRIREAWPRLPIIMCSSLTARGADITLRALASGATDYVAKPSSIGGTNDGHEHFRAELLGKVKALGRTRTLAPIPRVNPVGRKRSGAPVSIVAIGCSTGGPTALAQLFADLPPDLSVPIVLVQHMPPVFTRLLAERLTASTPVVSTEGREGDLLEPGRAYIAPGGLHMMVHRQGAQLRLALNEEAPENSCRPAVDVLFRSVARTHGDGVLGVVLTGMGQDGARGAAHVAELGGTVIVQDAASCVVPSMPAAVAALGASEAAYPIERLGAEIVARVRRGQVGQPKLMAREEAARANQR